MPNKLWMPRQALRREIIRLLNVSRHPVSSLVIEQTLNVPQPSFLMVPRIDRCLKQLVRSGIVVKLTLQRADGTPCYRYQLAEGISADALLQNSASESGDLS